MNQRTPWALVFVDIRSTGEPWRAMIALFPARTGCILIAVHHTNSVQIAHEAGGIREL